MMKALKVFGLLLMVLFLASMMSCEFLSNLFGTTVKNMFDGGFKLAPTIVTNAFDFKITGIGTGFREYDKFPAITLFVTPTEKVTGKLITSMVRADFYDTIDDNGEARPIEVTPRGAVTTTRKSADIVFVFDTTGSMSGYLSTMTAKAQAFADTLAASDIDYRLGFVSFGDNIRKHLATDPAEPGSVGWVYPGGYAERLAPTSSADAFKTAVGRLAAYGGDDTPENQIDCLDYARTADASSNPWGSFQREMGFSYRDGSMVIFVLITDINYHTPASPGDVLAIQGKQVVNTIDGETTKLKNQGINCYVVGPTGYGYEELASGTNGKFYATGGDFAPIIDDIGTTITTRGDYMITFMTNDFTASKLHKIRLVLGCSLGNAQDIVEYTSPAVVNVKEAQMIFDKGLKKTE
jgi:hypothetical protein